MIRVLRETHETPRFVEDAIRLAGGLNCFGEPNYRAVWGWNRLTWIGGKWEDRHPKTKQLLREVIELRLEPKYMPVNRWHIERWMPPESYGSPFIWRHSTLEMVDGRSIEALGPYPSRGEYELAFTLETPKGEFVQLTPTVASYVARAIEWSRGQARSARKKSIDERVRQQDRAYDAYADQVLST